MTQTQYPQKAYNAHNASFPPGLRFACSSISFLSVTQHTTATQNVTSITLYRQPAQQAAVSSPSSASTCDLCCRWAGAGVFYLFFSPCEKFIPAREIACCIDNILIIFAGQKAIFVMNDALMLIHTTHFIKLTKLIKPSHIPLLYNKIILHQKLFINNIKNQIEINWNVLYYLFTSFILNKNELSR